ncbi:MAG: hypothetical protein WCP79_05460 [Bacillota bacterium]
MKLSVDQRIGNVLFVVEGEQFEVQLLKHIFYTLLDYRTLTRRRRPASGFQTYQSQTAHSTVYVISAPNSNVASVLSGKDYLDALYSTLYAEYSVNIDNLTTFFIFDRDNATNPQPVIDNLLSILQNPQDNDECERGGLLLLSYPSIESYLLPLCPAVGDGLMNANALKKHLRANRVQPSRISSDDLLGSYGVLENFITKHLGIDIESKLESYGHEVNKPLESYQSRQLATNGCYRFVSSLVFALRYLNVIMPD